MTEDILGSPYTRETLDLGADAEGPLTATLVRRPAENTSASAADGKPRGAVLYIHGFVDYFFQRELGDWWAAQGYDFYALDLRKYGRSHTDGQTFYYTEDLADYDLEINRAWQLITQPAELTALVLNSPWLDHFDPPLFRVALTAGVSALARVKPRAIVQPPKNDPAAESLHQKFGGEWSFDETWKTFDFPPIYAGW